MCRKPTNTMKANLLCLSLSYYILDMPYGFLVGSSETTREAYYLFKDNGEDIVRPGRKLLKGYRFPRLNNISF